MKTTSRRALLGMMSAGAAALVLSGCVTTAKVGTTTTTVINVAKVESFVEAGLNASNTVAGFLTLMPVLGKHAVPLHNATEFLTTAYAAFTDAAGSQATIVYNSANWKTITDSVLSALTNLVGTIADVLSDLYAAGTTSTSADTITKVQIAHDALATVVAVFQALLSPQTSMTTPSRQTELSALRTLGVNRAV